MKFRRTKVYMIYPTRHTERYMIIDRESTFCNHARKNIVYNTYLFLEDLVHEYPSFTHWFFSTYVNDLFNGNRKLILAYIDNTISGVALLKDSKKEKKICSLRVSSHYQKQSIGTNLFELSFEVLKTRHPFFTVSDNYIQQFSKLFVKLNQQNCAKYTSYYRLGESEYAFNGFLPTNNLYSPTALSKVNSSKVFSARLIDTPHRMYNVQD